MCVLKKCNKATVKFNRHCPICYTPVKAEYALSLGVLGCLGDFDIIHENCMGAWSGNGELLNFFSLKDSDQESLKIRCEAVCILQ